LRGVKEGWYAIGQGGLAAMGLLGWRRKRKALNRMGVDQIDPSL